MLAVLAALGLLAGCGSRHAAAVAPAPASAPVATSSSSTTPTTKAPPKKPVAHPAVCPLTDLPAPGGQVPKRPALAIKVENLPAARPQYGLAQADVVYEEPVEAGITRFIVIYQCNDSSHVEPVRSGRWIDPDLLSQYGAHPLFAYAGAVQPVVDKVDTSSLIDVGVDRAPVSDFWRDFNRPAPHNLVTSTEALYAYGFSHGASRTPPRPVFQFGPLPHTGTPAAAVSIPYEYSPVTWTWHPSQGVYFRSYSDTGPATLGGGGQISAANVVIMHVVPYQSSFVEDVNGDHETLLVLTGSGPLEVVRNGAAITGTWNRPNLSDLTKLLDSKGHLIPLAPGVTWIELVPTTIPYTVTP
jgi:hypothetical protein